MNAQQEEALSNIDSHHIPENAESMTVDDWLAAKNELQMFLFAHSSEEDFEGWIDSNSDIFNTFYQQYFASNKAGLLNWYRGIHNGDISGDNLLQASWQRFKNNEMEFEMN